MSNHSLSTTIFFKTLVEMWSNKLTNYSTWKVLGCPTYYRVNDSKLTIIYYHVNEDRLTIM